MPRARSPIALLESLGVLNERALLIHCVRVDADDIGAIARRDIDAASPQCLGELATSLLHQLALGLALGDVHGEWQFSLTSEGRGGAEERVGHGVGRVWRDADADQRRGAFLHLGDLCAERGDGLVTLGGVGTEHFAVTDASRAALEHRVEGRAGVPGVGEGRDSILPVSYTHLRAHETDSYL